MSDSASLDFSQHAPQGRTGELFKLAWPLMFSNLAYTAVGFTDTVIMGRLGVTEVGAVGFANMCVLTLQLLFRGSLNSAATFVARAFGQGEAEGVRRWASVFLTLALAGFPLALLGPLLVDGLFALLHPDPRVAGVARAYAHIRILEAPLVMLGSTSLAVMLGLGNTRTPMILSWTVMLLNLMLAALFVFGFHWGVVGAAWATVLAVCIQNALAFFLLGRLHGRTYGRFWFTLPTRAELASFVRVGIPAGLTELGELSAFTAFQGVISRLGPVQLAASQIAVQLASLGFLPAYALATATGSLLSRALGAGLPEVATRIGWRGVMLAAALMGALGLVFLAAPRALIGIFNSDPLVLQAGAATLAVMAAFQILDGTAIVLGGALGGAGDTRLRLLVSLPGAWLIMVLGAVPLSLHFGVPGAWVAALGYISLTALLYALRFRSGRWRRAQL